jgi:acetate kinase
VLWLERHLVDGEDLQDVLEKESGLLGLCGTDDMRVVHTRVAASDPDAQLAFDVWRHRVIEKAGACIAVMGGLDALVFTGGIGEHDPVARAALVEGLGWLGVAVRDRSDDAGEREITGPGSSIRCFVIPAREELQLAAEARSLLEPA